MTATNRPDPLLDVEEVAQRLGVTVRLVRRNVAAREIPFIKLRRLLRFDPAEIDAWVERARVPTAKDQLSAERNRRAARHAGGHGVTGPPFRPVTSIRATRAAERPSARKGDDGLDPPSAS